MISPKFFIEQLQQAGIEFFAGVPDSLLKNMCAYITDHFDDKHNIIAANEGGAVALAAGYHLATGKVGCVYMQNSGEGNAVNPLASLTDRDVYHIPLLLIIGWRGRPGVHDEPQHVKQGKITTALLDVMGIRYEVLAKDENAAGEQIEKAMQCIRKTGDGYALVVEKDTFDNYTLQSAKVSEYTMSRENAIRTVAASIPANAIIVSTTGMISRELFEYRTDMGQGHERDFLTVGSMGHAAMIALRIAVEKPGRKVWCLDGDGASLMHLGALPVIGKRLPSNLVHVIINNGAHETVGGMPVCSSSMNIPALASAAGYPSVFSADSEEALQSILKESLPGAAGPVLIEVRCACGSRSDLGRPTTTPVENRDAFMSFLQK